MKRTIADDRGRHAGGVRRRVRRRRHATCRSTPTRSRPELLYLGSHSAITAVRARARHDPVPGDRCGPEPRLVGPVRGDQRRRSRTTLRTLDPATGAELARRTVPGVFAVRVVSEDGATVALAPPMPDRVRHLPPDEQGPDAAGDRPARRSRTAGARRCPGTSSPRRSRSTGDALFVIDFVPPLAPERYRVARLDLELGTVGDVRNYEQELQEPMRGTAHAQVMAPDGRRLYTLYTREATPTNRPSRSSTCSTSTQMASCVDLPPEFATDPLGALAVSPSGNRLYVYAPIGGALAELDTNTSRSTRTATVPPPIARGRRRHAPPPPTRRCTCRSRPPPRRTRRPRRRWTIAPGAVIGMKPSTDGSVLYVSLVDRVLVVDPRTLAPRRELDVPPEPDPIDHVAPALPPIPDPATRSAPADARSAPGRGVTSHGLRAEHAHRGAAGPAGRLHRASASIRPRRCTRSRCRRPAIRTSTRR